MNKAIQPKIKKTAALLTIRGPGQMSKAARSDIVKWLHAMAKDLERHGDDYTEGRFRAGFHYV